MNQARVKELLSYDPDTGIFCWRVKRANKEIGDVAGNLNKALGYIQIGIDYKLYYAHRLAWLYMYGEWPPQHTDHINGNCQDNRIANLRVASASQNCANARQSKNNTTGFKGVYRHRGRFHAHIMVNRQTINIGAFATAEEAAKAYIAKAEMMFGEFARAS